MSGQKRVFARILMLVEDKMLCVELQGYNVQINMPVILKCLNIRGLEGRDSKVRWR